MHESNNVDLSKLVAELVVGTYLKKMWRKVDADEGQKMQQILAPVSVVHSLLRLISFYKPNFGVSTLKGAIKTKRGLLHDKDFFLSR